MLALVVTGQSVWVWLNALSAGFPPDHGPFIYRSKYPSSETGDHHLTAR